MKKGTRVEWDDKGKKMYGVVFKGGNKRITVVLDGGKLEMCGPASLFHQSDTPLPKDAPSPMDKWAVASYKEWKHGHGDSPTFKATITLSGKKVIEASNDGWGGPNLYCKFQGVADSVVEQFYGDAKAWAIQFGDSKPIEPEDSWVGWYQHSRPYGETAETYFRTMNEYLAEMHSAR